MAPAEFKEAGRRFAATLATSLKSAGYADKADATRCNYLMVVVLLELLVVYAALAYGPVAAWLVELFPARIRYTSMSVPYHVGFGWFGGFLPTVTFSIVAMTGDIYSGLWYPVGVAVASAVIGAVWLPDSRCYRSGFATG